MLVLTRKVGERILIGNAIVVTVVRIQGDKVRLGIDAPPEVHIHREEVYRRVMAAQHPERGRGQVTPETNTPASDAGRRSW